MLNVTERQNTSCHDGVCILSAEEESFDDTTEVTFNTLSQTELEFYVDTYKPFDKAGAYGAQDWIGMVAIKKINGSYFNVMGSLIHKVYQHLIIGHEKIYNSSNSISLKTLMLRTTASLQCSSPFASIIIIKLTFEDSFSTTKKVSPSSCIISWPIFLRTSFRFWRTPLSRKNRSFLHLNSGSKALSPWHFWVLTDAPFYWRPGVRVISPENVPLRSKIFNNLLGIFTMMCRFLSCTGFTTARKSISMDWLPRSLT